MTDIVLVIDQEGRYLQVPSTGAPGFLQASDGLVGRTMYDVMRAEQAEFFVTKVKDAVRLQETQTFEYPFVVEGSERWFSAAVSPMSGGVAVVVQRDVTTIKQNEQALASWQERQLTMVNSVDAILWEAPADFSCFTFVSEQAERLLGYPLEHWMNEPSFWADHIHPDDREWCVNFCLMKTAEGQDHDFEYRLIAADGRTVWLRDIVSVVMEEGKPVALRGVMVDITQLKQAFTQLSDQEQEYRAVFEATSDGIVITDPEAGVLVAANPAFCRMHGYEDMKGMRPYEFIHPESHKLFEKFREDLMSGKEFRSRAQDVRKDGSVFDVEVLGRGFTYKGKSALLGVVRDVTEETRAFQLLEQRVAERTRELESLLGVARAVASTLDMNGLVRLVLQQLKEVVDYRAASLILVDNEDLVVYDLVEATTEGVVGQSAGIRFRRPSSSSNWQATSSSHSSLDFPCVQVAASEKFWQQIEAQSSVIVRDVLTSEDELAMAYRETMGDRLIENPQLATVRSWMAVPLTVKNQVTGYIGVSSEQPGYFSEKHVQMVRAFADYASVAIENAQLYEQAHEAAASEERQRLARELHDAVTQTLFSTSLIAEVVPSLWETKPELARQRLEDMRRLTRGALAEMRTLLLELRPGTLTELPLTDLLRQLSEATAGRTSLKIRLDLATESPVTLPGEVQVALYRIAQEALNNVVRHAGAKGATVRLAYEDGDACLQISDDGRGFDVTAIPGGHLGVGIMRERAETIGASIELESSPENGTSITVVWSATKGDRG